MVKMHKNEWDIDATLVRYLVEKQCPQWTNLSIEPVVSSGTDNALFHLGQEYIVRLPRLDGGTPNINKECEWLPKLATFLPFPISMPEYKGHPDDAYPYAWTIAKWNKGNTPEFEKGNEFIELAKDLAKFINALHAINLPNGPLSRRGIPLNSEVLDLEVGDAIAQLKDEMDTLTITALWQELSNIPYWPKDPVWIHGDLLPGNILVEQNRLSAVIDFSDVGIGDPACDLIPAWSLFNDETRMIFKNHLNDIDEDTWQRGRGWALSIALIALPYYKHSNPVFASVAKTMLEQVLVDC